MRRIVFSSIPAAIVAVLISASLRADPVHEVSVVARSYAFEPSVIRVTAGEPVRLVIRSADRVHGFAIRDLKVEVKVPRSGEAVSVEFIAPPAGRYEISCSEFCGSGHGRMKAVLVSAAATQVERSISKE